MTLHERYQEYFNAHGFEEVPSRSKKYTMYKKEVELNGEQKVRYYFLGKNGAIRYSLNDSSSHSVSISDWFYPRLIYWERSTMK